MTKVYEMLLKNKAKDAAFVSVEVTPEAAAELLTLNTRNRKIKRNIVDKYAGIMAKGGWMSNSSSIGITKSGVMSNGQHRLEGIIKSNTVQKLDFRTGLEEASVHVEDAGALRTAGDSLQIEGFEKYASETATAAKLLIAYDHAKRTPSRAGKDPFDTSVGVAAVLTNSDVLAWVDAHKEDTLLFNCIIEGGIAKRKTKFLSQPNFAVLMYRMYKKDAVKAKAFFTGLISGENIGAGATQTIVTIRRKLTDALLDGSHVTYKRAILIKGWNEFRAGNGKKNIAWNNADEFPNIE